MPSDPDKNHTAEIEQRRVQIMYAAMNVFSRMRYGSATMSTVPTEAGIAIGTVYNYFSSKRELLIAIAENYVIAPFREIVENRPGSDREFLAAILGNCLSLGLEDLTRFLALIYEVQRDPQLRRRYCEQALLPVLNKLEEYVRQRMADGTFRERDPALIVGAVGRMYIGFLLIWPLEGNRAPVKMDNPAQLAWEMADLVLDGVRTQ